VNEHQFTKAVVNKLPKDVHVQSMTMASLTTNGTPDRYIDYKVDLWAEFKMARTHGRNGYNVGDMLSGPQRLWLRRRFNAGGNCVVVVGVPSDKARGFILTTPDEWDGIIQPAVFIPRLMYAGELAGRLLERVS
jgi:hypothetical protein